MKLDQIAFYAHNEKQVASIKSQLGLTGKSWIEDFVVGDVKDGTGLSCGKSEGHLRFNYDLGIEVEILTYLSGWHWHISKPEFKQGLPFVSHIGFHMDATETSRVGHDDFLLQIMDTESHTNPYLIEKGRKYHYEIFAGAMSNIVGVLPIEFNLIGVDRKYIWRIES